MADGFDQVRRDRSADVPMTREDDLPEARYRSIVENALEGVFVSTPDGRILMANPALALMLGYPTVEAFLAGTGRRASGLYVDPGQQSVLHKTLHRFGQVRNFEAELRRNDGTTVWVSESSHVVRDASGEIVCFEGFVTDITERRRAELRLAQAAKIDALTGLGNRGALLERLGQRIARARRKSDWGFGLIHIDLDRFKVINDEFGSTVGDLVLHRTADRLATALRQEDLVVRLESDKFAVLLDDVADQEEALGAARRLREAICQPVSLTEPSLVVAASIGVIVAESQRDDPGQMLHDAELATEHAKAQGRRSTVAFIAEMRDAVVSRLSLEADLRRSIKQDGLKVAYQPIVDLVSGRLAGFEALARWHHPERGVVHPKDFIPLAEECGLIEEVGRSIMLTATAEFAAWANQRADRRNLRLAVNVSPIQIRSGSILQVVEEALSASRLPPDQLRLEITETAVLETPAHVEAALGAVREMGIGIAMDDFGTGYSSLAQIHRLPIDVLKIDRSFIHNLTRKGHDSDPIVRTIIALGRALGLSVVAEGVETQTHLDHLRMLNCDFVQGYLLGRPANQFLDPCEVA